MQIQNPNAVKLRVHCFKKRMATPADRVRPLVVPRRPDMLGKAVFMESRSLANLKLSLVVIAPPTQGHSIACCQRLIRLAEISGFRTHKLDIIFVAVGRR